MADTWLTKCQSYDTLLWLRRPCQLRPAGSANTGAFLGPVWLSATMNVLHRGETGLGFRS